MSIEVKRKGLREIGATRYSVYDLFPSEGAGHRLTARRNMLASIRNGFFNSPKSTLKYLARGTTKDPDLEVEPVWDEDGLIAKVEVLIPVGSRSTRQRKSAFEYLKSFLVIYPRPRFEH